MSDVDYGEPAFMEEDSDDLFSFSGSPPNFPPIPQWGALMAEIANSHHHEAPSEPPGRTMPLQYHLLPPQQGFQPEQPYTFPSVAYPEVPFWTGAPLPFHPQAYPQSVLPLHARQGVLAASEEARQQPARSKKSSKKNAGRNRASNGMFVSKVDETQMLKGKIKELEAALQRSNEESAYLREALRVSAQELNVLRSQGLVQQGALAWQQQPSQPAAPPSNPFREKSPRPLDEAFRVSLDYAKIKKSLRPTGFNYEPPRPDPL